MKTLRIILLISLIVSMSLFLSKAQNYSWISHIGGENLAGTEFVKSDNYGNVYLGGLRRGEISFIDSDPLVSLVSAETLNTPFLARYIQDGTLDWALGFGDNKASNIKGIHVDVNGDVFVVGSFQSGVSPDDPFTIRNRFGEDSLFWSRGNHDLYLAKYNSNGELLFASNYGSSGVDRMQGVSTNVQGNIFIVGFWNGGILDLGNEVSLSFNGVNHNGFFARLSSAGITENAIAFTGPWVRFESSLSACLDEGFFSALNFRTSIDIPGFETIYATNVAPAHQQVFVKLNYNGEVEWFHHITSTNDVYGGNNTVSDSNGNVYITGRFASDVTFPSNSGSALTLVSNGSYDGYIAKYDSKGNLLWAKNFGGTSVESSSWVALSDEVISLAVTTETTNNSFLVGGQVGIQDTIKSTGFKDAVLINLDTDGNYLGYASATGALNDEALSTTILPNGNTVLAGSFNSSPLYAGDFSLTCLGSSDAFLAHHINIHLLPTVSEISCSQGHDGTLGLEVFGGGQEPYTYEFSLVGGDEIDAGVYSAPLSYDNLEAGVYKFTVTDDLGRTVTKFYHLIAPDPIDINGVVTDVTGCYGGENGGITLTVTGGVGGYTYFWDTPDGYGVVPASQNQSSLTAGTYVVTVTDENGCFATETFEITQPLQINFKGTILTGNTSTDPLTPNGSIDLVVNNGIGPYTYSWKGPNGFESADEDLSGIRGGTYILSVLDDNGCFKDTSVNVPDNHLFNAWIIETGNPKCKGGSDGFATVEYFNSTGGVTIEWSNGQSNVITATNLSAGEYSVTLTDDMGTPSDASDDISISLMPVLIGEPDFALSVTPTVTKTTCPADNDGSIQLTVNGWSQPYNFNWSTTNGSGLVNEQKDQYNLTVGSYTYSVTDRYGCVVGSSVNLSSSYAAPSFTVDVSPGTDVCEGTEILVTASPGFSYQFFVDEVTQGEFSPVNTFTIPNPTNGMVVKVVGMNTAGCTSQSDEITIAVTPNVGEPSFTSGESMLCAGSSEVYLATAENAETIVYSIESGTATVNPTTGEVSDVDSDFTIRATATGINGCGEKYVDLAVTVNPIPTPTISTSDRTDWTEGEEVSVTFTVDITEAIYQWQKDGVDIAEATNAAYTATAQGEYSVLVTKAGCTGESNKISVNVTSISTYTITFNVQNAGQQPIANAKVSVAGFSPVETNASGVAAIDAADGTYDYTITASDYVDYQDTFTVNGEDKQIEVSMLAVSAEINEVSDIKLFPNPFTNEIRISESYKVKRVVITNIAGQKVMDIHLDGADRISTQSLSSGVYLIRIISHNDESVTFRMVKDS